MSDTQNPVYADNTTIAGDGTKVHPLRTLGGGASPGGANTNIQFNDGGVFAGDPGLTWDKTTGSFIAASAANANSAIQATGNMTISLLSTFVTPPLIAIQNSEPGGFINVEATDSCILKSDSGSVLIQSPGTVLEAGTGQTLGFFNTPPVARPTVTGSRGGNAALASLLTQLATLGLIVDGSS